jgi:cytochrome c556
MPRMSPKDRSEDRKKLKLDPKQLERDTELALSFTPMGLSKAVPAGVKALRAAATTAGLTRRLKDVVETSARRDKYKPMKSAAHEESVMASDKVGHISHARTPGDVAQVAKQIPKLKSEARGHQNRFIRDAQDLSVKKASPQAQKAIERFRAPELPEDISHAVRRGIHEDAAGNVKHLMRHGKKR